jgi:hypothetical protein
MTYGKKYDVEKEDKISGVYFLKILVIYSGKVLKKVL